MILEDFLGSDVLESDANSNDDDRLQSKSVKDSRKEKPKESSAVAPSIDVQGKSKERGDEITLIMLSPEKASQKTKTSVVVSSSESLSSSTEEEVLELPQMKRVTNCKSSTEPGFGRKSKMIWKWKWNNCVNIAF